MEWMAFREESLPASNQILPFHYPQNTQLSSTKEKKSKKLFSKADKERRKKEVSNN